MDGNNRSGNDVNNHNDVQGNKGDHNDINNKDMILLQKLDNDYNDNDSMCYNHVYNGHKMVIGNNYCGHN